MQVPKTRTSMIEGCRSPSDVHWIAFDSKYRPMMAGYLAKNWKSIRDYHGDVINETILALMKILPTYHYERGVTPAFHTFVTLILDRQANKCWRKNKKYVAVSDRDDDLQVCHYRFKQLVYPHVDEWRHRKMMDAMNTAISAVLGDESIKVQRRSVFKALVVKHESPEVVAAQFGMTRNAVDQIKHVLTEKCEKIAKNLVRSTGIE